MATLQTLREIVAATDGVMPSETMPGGLPSGELRFVLEYAEAPELGEETEFFSELLESQSLLLRPMPGLERFLVLRFPGVERTLPARDLFDIAYELASARDLTSVEPDTGSRTYADPVRPAAAGQVESAAVLGRYCWTDAEAPADTRWPLALTGILDAWSRTAGEGIVIAQPDTGIAAHAELEARMLDMVRAFDVLEGVAGATDPLTPGTANPGHGTGTASVAASRGLGRVTGAAPGATLVPIRCIDDVKVFDAAPVAAAIVYAVEIGADVISLSLGGVPSRALHEAIRRAVAAGIVVVAAAGNCIRTVVWPARYPEVVAVAGSDAQDMPWKGSSRGSAVDITAPAELVWRAQRSRSDEPEDVVEPGQGTSFATALVAGTAALWLARHGRDAVRAEAADRGVDVSALFRSALRATVRVPSGWRTEFGPGILDAKRLLDHELREIPRIDADRNQETIALAVTEEQPNPVAEPTFDFRRFGAEIGSILLEQARLGVPIGSLSSEAKTLTTRPSRGLSRAASATRDARLRRFGETQGRTTVERPLARSPGVRTTGLGAALSLKGTGLESTRGLLGQDRLRELLGGGGLNTQMDGVRDRLDARALSPGAKSMIEDLAERAFAELRVGSPRSSATKVMVEALIRLNGRPVVRVREGAIATDDPDAGEWADRFALWQAGPEFSASLAGVGRIDADGAHVGTGWVVAAGVVMTNRHVVQAFAAPIPRRNSPERWLLTGDPVTIDFADEPGSDTAASRFRVKSVIWAGESEIDPDEIDFSDLDVALLEVETTNDAGAPLPDAGTLAARVTATDRHREVVVVGYPAQPTTLPVDVRGDYDMEVITKLNEMFRQDYGRKYAAPGLVTVAPGGDPTDPRHWMFEHDSTTLAGNSGSCVLGPAEFFAAVGLHFGGRWRHGNYAHSLGRLNALGAVGGAVSLPWVGK